LLARHLVVPLSAVQIRSGAKSRTKHVSVAGVTELQVLSLALS
jgi:uncharacterized protein YggU (UPF0235/DUF167 family)